MAYQPITIGGNTYNSYATVAQGDAYEGAAFGTIGDAWRAADVTTKSMALVTATRNIDSLGWGAGVTADAGWQAAVINGCIEWAAALVEGSFAETLAQASDPTRMVKAGSAEVQFFRIGSSSKPSPFPAGFLQVMSTWMATISGGSLPSGAQSFGTDRCSTFDQDFETKGYG